VSPDSIVPDPANPQSLNRYSYVLNRPLVLTDPSGHMPSDGCEYEGCLSDPDSWGWGFIDYLLQNTDFNDPSDNPAGQIIVRTFDFILPLGTEDAAPINEIVTEAIVGSNSLINQGMDGWYPLASPSEVLVVTGAFIVAAESEAGDHLDGGGPAVNVPTLNRASQEALPFSDSGLKQRVTDVLDNIEQGGPFPYKRDGIVFKNREALLPNQAEGYYREFTVPTPGATGRGAQRLVVGQGGEVYYTLDHYSSFVQIR
jgi:ribonuclease T1